MTGKRSEVLKYFLELSKYKIMLPVTLTGFTGYFIYNPHLTQSLFLVTAGIFLMSVSASVLNQIQEVKTDGKMLRTRNRPLPSGLLTVSSAIIIFLITFLSGGFLIYLTGSIAALIISLVTILWYNGVYTYLKRITPFAVIPGAITGALPPLIGWLAAGGSMADKGIIILMAVLFIGQIPHFWLFILKYGEEYENAGLPSLTTICSGKLITRWIFVLIIITGVAVIFLEILGVIINHFISIAMVVLSALIIWQFYELSGKKPGKDSIGRYSVILNIYFLLIMILLITDRIVIPFSK